MNILGKYNQAKTITFDLVAPDGVDLITNATFAAGDVVLMSDEGAEANTTNLPTDEGTGYSLVLTAAEMSMARGRVYIIDQTGTKVWLDKSIGIETYGNASAEHAFDLDTASTAQTGDSFARLGAPAGASVSADVADIPTVSEFNARTLASADYFDPAVDAVATVTNLTNLPSIPANWLTAAGIAASALDGKGDWNIGKTGYTLTQAFPTNFSDLSISVTTGQVELLTATQASIDAIEFDTDTTIPALIASVETKVDDVQGATFNTATDSLEAIRDRGDAAWVTGAGGSSPSAADIRAEIDSNSTQLAAIVADTNELQGDWVDGGRLDLILDATSTQASVDAVDSNVDAILLDTNTTIPGLIAALNNISEAQVNAQCDTAISDAALATAASLATVDSVADAIKVVTDQFVFTIANQVDSNVQSINDVTITGDGSATPFDV